MSNDIYNDAMRYSLFDINAATALLNNSLSPVDALTGASNGQLPHQGTVGTVGATLTYNDLVHAMALLNNKDTPKDRDMANGIDYEVSQFLSKLPECTKLGCEFEFEHSIDNLTYILRHNDDIFEIEDHYRQNMFEPLYEMAKYWHVSIAIFDGGPLDGKEMELDEYTDTYKVPLLEAKSIETVTYYRLNNEAPYVYTVTRP